MNALWLTLALLAAPPQLDGTATLEGAALGVPERLELPHGRHTADVAETMFIAAGNATSGGGGLDLFDPMALSVHGLGVTQLQLLWGGLDITDPARPGQPLIDLPVAAWTQLRLHTVWTDRPGIRWQAAMAPGAVPIEPVVRVQGAWARPAGNSDWMPRGAFDRDPAWDFGAPRRRRALQDAREGELSMVLPLPRGMATLTVEHLEHQHRYLTLDDLEPATRDTAVVAYSDSSGPIPWELRGAYQLRHRSAEGAQSRWDGHDTQDVTSRAWLLQLEGRRQLGPLVRVDAGLGGGQRHERARSVEVDAVADDLSGQWLQTARPRRAGATARWHSHARLLLTLSAAPGALAPPRRPSRRDPAPAPRTWPGPARDAQAAAAPRAEPDPAGDAPQPMGALSAQRLEFASVAASSAADADAELLDAAQPNAAALQLEASGTLSGWRHALQPWPVRRGLMDAGTPLQMEALEGPQDGALMRHELRVAASAHLPLGEPRRRLVLVGGIDHSGMHSGQFARSASVPMRGAGPSAGAALTWRLGDFDTFALVRREPERLTAELGDFLGAPGPAGSIYAWGDADGDGLPGASEAGARLGGFGAPAHTRDAQLLRPGHTQMALGGRTPSIAGLQLGLRTLAHVLTGRYTTAADGEGTALPFRDPGGDGRGERPAPGGGQILTAYAEPAVPARHRVVNGRRAAYYLGVEAELRTVPGRRWFLHVLGAAYLSRGEAPFGSFADRNDPSALSEASSTRNAQLNAWGRYDHDRSYAAKVMLGVRPARGLSLALAARYRDGEPFTRIVVDGGLPQGPTALMAVARGKVRHTAHTSLDLRARYTTLALRPLAISAVADVYNLLGSATELLEDPRTGPSFRRPIEAHPGRSAWVGLSLAFAP